MNNAQNIQNAYRALQKMGYQPDYISRAIGVFDRNLNQSRADYDLSLLVDIIARLKRRDKFKSDNQALGYPQYPQRQQQPHQHPPNFQPHQPPKSQPSLNERLQQIEYQPHMPPKSQPSQHQRYSNEPFPDRAPLRPQMKPARSASAAHPRPLSKQQQQQSFLRFQPHFDSIQQALSLRVNDAVDYRFENGRYLLCKIVERMSNYNQHITLLLHPLGTPPTIHKYDRYCDLYHDWLKLAPAQSVTLRWLHHQQHPLYGLQMGDYLDINPSISQKEGHNGWRPGRIMKLDPYSSQIKVSYLTPAPPAAAAAASNHNSNEHSSPSSSFWVHLENEQEAAPFNTKCKPIEHDEQPSKAAAAASPSEEFDMQFGSSGSSYTESHSRLMMHPQQRRAGARAAGGGGGAIRGPQRLAPRSSECPSPNYGAQHVAGPFKMANIPSLHMAMDAQRHLHLMSQQQQHSKSSKSNSGKSNLEIKSNLSSASSNNRGPLQHHQQQQQSRHGYLRHPMEFTAMEQERLEEMMHQLHTFGFSQRDMQSAMRQVANPLDINEVIAFIQNHDMDAFVKEVSEQKQDSRLSEEDEQYEDDDEDDDESLPDLPTRQKTGADFDAELKAMAEHEDILMTEVIHEMSDEVFQPPPPPPEQRRKRPRGKGKGKAKSKSKVRKNQRDQQKMYQGNGHGHAHDNHGMDANDDSDPEYDDEKKDNVHELVEVHQFRRSAQKNRKPHQHQQQHVQKREMSPSRMQLQQQLVSDSMMNSKQKQAAAAQANNNSAAASPFQTIFRRQHARRSSSKVFGVDTALLSATLILDKDYASPIPNILIKLKEELFENNGHLANKIFLHAGATSVANKKRLFEIEQQMNDGHLFEIDYSSLDVYLIASILKLWFRKLPHSVFEAVDVVAMEQCNNTQTAAEIIKQRIKEPMLSYYKWLLDLCIDIIKFENVNKMNINSLSVVIAPNLYDISKVDPANAMQVSNDIVKFVQLSILWRMK